ncbi:MAG: extracellular solute-binding protein [Petrotogales bacterium]
MYGKSFRRTFIMLIVFVLCAALLTFGATKVKEIRIAIEATGQISEEFARQLERFNEAHEDIHVSVRTFSGGDAYNQALMGQIAGGIAPDVFLVDGGERIKMFVDYNALLPLDHLASGADLNLDNFETSLLNAFIVDERIYGIPKDYNTTALFYHKDLFEDKGLAIPETWNELEVAAEILTDGDVYGLGMYPQINYLLPFIESAGAHFVTAEGIDMDEFLSDEHIEALKFIQSLYVDKEIAVSPQMIGAGWDGAMFANKQVAMVYGGSWIPGVVLGQDPDAPIGAAPLPIKEEKSSMLYTAGWVISNRSRYPEAAMTLIKFLVSDTELVDGNLVGLIGLPPTESSMNKLIEAKKDDPLLETYSEVVKYGTPFGWMEPEFVDKYNRMLETLIYRPETKTVEQAVEDLAKEIE